MKPEMGLVLFTALVATTRVSAQSSCTNLLLTMVPCLDYITGNSSSPSQQCCNKLAYVVKSSPECLCQVLDGGDSQLGISVDINQTQALALPRACHVQTPPASRCNDGSLENSPAGSSNNSEHDNGSKAVPRNGSLSKGSSIKFSFLLISFIYVVYYTTI